MKYFILPFLLFQSVLAFSQNDPNIQKVTGFNTYGYIGGIRLDSVEAEYAQFYWRFEKEIGFDYGQKRERNKELAITDINGKILRFEMASTLVALNFFISINGN
ncbi:MAG: hypothetical protein WKF59_12140 [Chitinophagaceae bacterium]